jgi:type IV pilus assembly protein PilO
MSANTTTWREHLASPLTWHYAGFAVLLVAAVAMGARFGLDWVAISSHTHDTILDRQIQLHALKAETEPLTGLDTRLTKTSDQIKKFYANRIPANYSTIAAQIGNLEVASGVRLTSVRYAQRPPASGLSEIVIDAGITGEYPQIMKFINSVERDKIFFVISGMALTGQQAGAVNLRLQMSTWLRPEDAAASGIPKADEPAPQDSAAPAGTPEKEGQPQ